MKQVYIHGLGQTPASWESVLRRLAASEDCLCPDLSKIIPDKDVTYPILYNAFAGLCDGLEPPLTLCGLSLGGVLALHYAAEHPERVDSLVLIAPQFKMPKRLLQMQNVLFHLMPRPMFQGTGFTKSQFMQLCSSMMDLDLSGQLSRVSCPTLVLCGSLDLANKRACAELAQLLCRAELRVVDSAGHELNQQAPEKLAQLLRDFYIRTYQGGNHP